MAGMFDGGTITDIGGPDSKYDESGNPVSWNPETESYTSPDVIDWSKYMGSAAGGGLPSNWQWYLLIAAGIMFVVYFTLLKRKK